MPLITIHEPTFYSHLDEEMFFTALKKISAVRNIEGRNRSGLCVSLQSRPSDKALRELLGLFFRFDLDMRELAQFLTEENRPWFHAPEKYWFKKVFSKR